MCASIEKPTALPWGLCWTHGSAVGFIDNYYIHTES